MMTTLAVAKAITSNRVEDARSFTRLDDMDPSRVAQHVVAYTPTAAEIGRFLEKGKAELGTFATLDTVHRIISSNPDTLHALNLRIRHDINDPQAQGFIAWLPLTAAGKRALLDGSFDAAEPALQHLAGQNERPAAIYVWGMYAPGRLAAGIVWAHQRWSTPLCRDADIYARAATSNGLRFMERIGFERLSSHEAGHLQKLFIYRRSCLAAPLPMPLYDTYPSATRKHTVTVVRSHDDLAKVMAIRAAAFMSEQACPYEEEFDGNDFSSTHLLGYIDNEPAACLRVRCFATFAKVERLVVRAEHRNSRLAFVIVRAAHELCRMKGYTRVYGHAQKRLVDFWGRAGARPFPGAREFTFSDYDYVEMLAEIPAHPDAITVGRDPYVIIRPEGRWHTAGVLERSADRPVSTPSSTPHIRKRRSA